MRIPLISTLLFWGLTSLAQQVPDLTSKDHFLFYMSEEKKQDEIVKSYENRVSKKYPQSSEELYPHLYKFTHRDYLGPIRGTSADPANAFQNYSKTNNFQKPVTSSVVALSLYDNSLSIEERNRQAVEADMAAYEARKKESEELLIDAYKTLEKPIINYHLGIHNGPSVDRFTKAYSELTAMLDGSQKIDFLKATWLVESSVDKTLSWDEFNKMFQDGAQIISALMAKEKLSRSDNLAKIMAIYKYMADTTKVFLSAREKTVISKPMLYDFEDYKAEKDITKVFVSKLLRTGTGQCMSLPMLYYLYAKAFNANATLAFAPQHTYITFEDRTGNRQNIELTGRMFTPTDFYWQSGFIKSEQVKSGIYLKPLSEKEVIAHLLTTLTLSYVKTFGTDERVFDMAMTANRYSPNDLTANMILAGYSQDLYNHVLRQYDVFHLSEAQLAGDEQAKTAKDAMQAAVDHVTKDLGYSKMPDWAYQQWLDGVNNLANKQQHIVRRRQLEQQLNR